MGKKTIFEEASLSPDKPTLDFIVAYLDEKIRRLYGVRKEEFREHQTHCVTNHNCKMYFSLHSNSPSINYLTMLRRIRHDLTGTWVYDDEYNKLIGP